MVYRRRILADLVAEGGHVQRLYQVRGVAKGESGLYVSEGQDLARGVQARALARLGLRHGYRASRR